MIIAGPNGAGKSTSAPLLLPPGFPFINADDIAAGLAREERRDWVAGRLLLKEWQIFERERRDFAVETTLASRSLAARLDRARKQGYRCRLIYLWLASSDLAVARVAERVRAGGHHVPEDIIRRRYHTGVRNLFGIYLPIVDDWLVFNNTWVDNPVLVASGEGSDASIIVDSQVWQRVREQSRSAERNVPAE